ncbi:dolichyl-diphosphooligosaccharide--protein glycosyltransferase subunit 1-like [Clavelina lepadiformis]|uniref:dolichyl-diphosphooligosaccharide--protein glycosyltransferase subunit 1-like n=1 Tax=Clavelina lepadiformis TaxID=159417 RepID=UPI0040438671
MRVINILSIGFVYFVLASAELINEDVNRVIDLRSHLVKVTTTVTLRNRGGPVSEFKFIVDPTHNKQLAHISFTQADDEGKVLKKVSSGSDDKLFAVTLPSKLENDGTFRFTAEEVYANALSPFPKEITQSQNQLMVYRGNHFYYSPYKSDSQSTAVELPSKTVESFTKFGNPEKEETTIKYEGTKDFDNVPPNSQNSMKIHFENNNPFLTVSQLTRVVEVSHWGNIAVEESIDVRHTGAKLKGSFSRYDYQRMPNSGAASVKSFKTILPAAASDVYYRDEIGNISTSNLLKTDDSVEFEIRPRYPLFGGWKTFYYFGYNLPSYVHIFIRGDLHALKMRFVDHVMDDQMIEDFTLKIILPEGAKNIKLDTPYPAERLPDQLHHTYLDTVGRPVIIVRKSNLVEQHIEDFVLSYNFNRMLLLQEPLLISAAFFLLFFTVLIIVRLDFSIAYDQASEAKMRVQGVIEQVQALQARREKCYEAYEAAVSKYKASKDHTTFVNTRKSIEKDHKEATNNIQQLVMKVREDAIDTADKVGNLNHIDGTLRDKYSSMMQLAEKLISKKVSRDQYVDQSGKLNKSIDDLKEKASETVDNLLV